MCYTGLSNTKTHKSVDEMVLVFFKASLKVLPDSPTQIELVSRCVIAS